MNQHDRSFPAITALTCALVIAYLLWQLFIR